MPFPQRDLWLRNPEFLFRSSESVTSQSDVTSGNGDRSVIKQSIRGCLQKVPYFREFSSLRLRQLIESGYRKVLRPSQILFQEGELGEAAYLVLSGSLESFSVKLDRCVKTYSATEFFGEVPIMLGIPYSVTTRALEETWLFVIPKRNFEKLLQSHLEFAELLAVEMNREKEIYAPLRQELQELGLLDMEHHHQGLINWISTRLKNLFGT